MNQKEVNELRHRWRLEKNAVSHIYGCFANSNKEIVSDLDEPLGTMPGEEAEKYLGLLKNPCPKHWAGTLSTLCSLPGRPWTARSTSCCPRCVPAR